MFTFFLKDIFWHLPQFIRSYINLCEVCLWVLLERPFPPPHFVKQTIIAETLERLRLTNLVETGTYYGDMVYANLEKCSQIFSIELSPELFQQAKNRFRNQSHIHIIHGDSASALKTILTKLETPTLFWLDGHYSGGVTALGDKECPVLEELFQIRKTNVRHAILIDDARCFNGTHDYPTLSSLQEWVEKNYKGAEFIVKNDVIRIIPHNILEV